MRVKKLKTSEKYTAVAGRSKISVEVEMRKRLGVWARRVLVLDGSTLYAYKAKGDGGSVGGWEVGGADVHVGKGSDITSENGKHILVVAKQPAFKLTFAFSTIYEQSRLIQALSSSGATVTGLDAILLLKNLTQKQKEEQEEEWRRKVQEEEDAHEFHEIALEGQNDDAIGRRRARSDAMLDPDSSLTDIRWSFSEGSGASGDNLSKSVVNNPLYDSELNLRTKRLLSAHKSVVPEDTFRRTASLPPAKRISPGDRKALDPINPLPKPPRTVSVAEESTEELLDTADGVLSDSQNGRGYGHTSPLFPVGSLNQDLQSENGEKELTQDISGDTSMRDSLDTMRNEFLLPSENEIDFSNEAQKIIDEIDADVNDNEVTESKNNIYVNVPSNSAIVSNNEDHSFDDLLNAMNNDSNGDTIFSEPQYSNIADTSEDSSMGNKNSMNEIVNTINSKTAKELVKQIDSITEIKPDKNVNSLKSLTNGDGNSNKTIESQSGNSLDELLAALNDGNNPYINGNNSDVEGQFDQLVSNMNISNTEVKEKSIESVTNINGVEKGQGGSPTKSLDDSKNNKISSDAIDDSKIIDKQNKPSHKNILESKNSINKKEEQKNNEKNKLNKQSSGLSKEKENKLEKQNSKKQTQNKVQNESSKINKKVSSSNSNISSPTKSTSMRNKNSIGENKKETFKKYISEKGDENKSITKQDNLEKNHNAKKTKSNEIVNTQTTNDKNKSLNFRKIDTTDSSHVTVKNNSSNLNDSQEIKKEKIIEENTLSNTDQNKNLRSSRKKNVELNSPLIISGQVELSGSAAGRLNPMYLEVRDGHVLTFPPKSATNTLCMSLQGMSVMPLLGMPNTLTMRKATRCMMVVKLESREEMLRWVRVLSDEVVRVTPADQVESLTLYPSKSDQSKDQEDEDDTDGRLTDLKNFITGKKPEQVQRDIEMNTIKKPHKHVTFRDEVQVIDEETPEVTTGKNSVRSLINQIKENHFGSESGEHQPLKRLSGFGKQSPVKDEVSSPRSSLKQEAQKTEVKSEDTPNMVQTNPNTSESQVKVDTTSNKDAIKNIILEEKQKILIKEELRKKPVVKPTIKRHSIDVIHSNNESNNFTADVNNHPVLRRLSGQGRWPPPDAATGGKRETLRSNSTPGLPRAEWEVTNILIEEGKVAPPSPVQQRETRSHTGGGKLWGGNNNSNAATAAASVPLPQQRKGSNVNKSWAQPKKVEIVERHENQSSNNNATRDSLHTSPAVSAPKINKDPVQSMVTSVTSNSSSSDVSDDAAEELGPGITWSVAAVREKFEMLNKVSGEKIPRQLVTESPINRRKSTKNSLKKKKSNDGVTRRGSIRRSSRRNTTTVGEVSITEQETQSSQSPNRVRQISQGSDSTDGGRDTKSQYHQQSNMDLPQALAVKLIPVKERMKNFEVTNRKSVITKLHTKTPLKITSDVYRELVEIDKGSEISVSTPSHTQQSPIRSLSPDSGIGVSSISSSSSTVNSLSPEPHKEVIICWRGPYIAQEAEQEVLNNINNAFLAKRRLLSKELHQERIRERLSQSEERLWELQQSLANMDELNQNKRNPSWSSLERELQETEEEVETWERRLVETQREAESARQKLTTALHEGMAQLQQSRGN